MLFLEKLEQNKIYIFGVILICMLIGIMYAVIFVPQTFISSTSVMLIKVQEADGRIENTGNVELTNNLISTLEELIKSDSSIEKVKERITINSQINKRSIVVKRISDSDTFQIRVKTLNEEESLEVNNEITELFSNKVKSMYKDTEVYIVDPSHIVNSNKTISIVFFGIIAILIGAIIDFIYIIVLIYFEKNVKNSKDIERNLSLKNLASIPSIKESNIKIIESESQKTLTNKAFKQLRSNIQFLNVNNKSKNIILITSPSKKEGKSYVSANLAVSYANVNKKVILIDADLISGVQSNIFNIPNETGLSNFLSNLDSSGIEINERINSFIKETNIKNLNIITSGTVPPNSSELLSSPKLAEMLKDLSVFYDVIILDGPQILNNIDSLILSRQVNSIGIVTHEKKTKKDDLWKTKRDIQNVGGRIIGVILNKVKTKEKVNHKILEKLKEKVKNYILKLRENRKQKLLEESKFEEKEETATKVVDIPSISKNEDNNTNKEIAEKNESNIETKEETEELIETKKDIIDEKETEVSEEQDIIVIEETDLKEEHVEKDLKEEHVEKDIENVNSFSNKETSSIKKGLKRSYKKFMIKIAKVYKKIKISSKEKANENEEEKIQSINNVETKKIKKDSENVVLVIVDANNELCRAFSKTCYTEKLVRGLDATDGFIKANYSSYLVNKRMEALMLMYSLTKKQVSRIDPMIYITLNDYDDHVWLEEKMTSNKAESYIFCMSKDYPRNEGESRKSYIERCKKLRKEELYNAEIEIEYNIDLLWKSSKMRFSDKIAMSKYAKLYGIEKKEKSFEEINYTSNYSEEDYINEDISNLPKSKKYYKKSKGINPIKKIGVEQVKVKTVEEISKEVEEELNAKKGETFNLKFPEIVIDELNDNGLQKKEKRKEAEVLKKIQREKNAKRKKEVRAKKQKEREEKNRQREEARRAKELEREKKIEEARIEEELLVDNLYPKTKNNKDL